MPTDLTSRRPGRGQSHCQASHQCSSSGRLGGMHTFVACTLSSSVRMRRRQLLWSLELLPSYFLPRIFCLFHFTTLLCHGRHLLGDNESVVTTLSCTVGGHRTKAWSVVKILFLGVRYLDTTPPPPNFAIYTLCTNCTRQGCTCAHSAPLLAP